ncbi:hypothetical protein PPYR_01612 [Photinus pyralis]|uniref:GPI ethanolamine phosphate transferase 2 C-terminal domain-containing protein n=1 Tax=Photinus pyralis TaxID=7054 RepID=A0A5N4B4X4_PHOPY|nr:GPI ethanolamine phosphate transferase 2 [Photinus pyralis]KAB0804642.1 hypothetical protein PPYR_01612 [Photinus pyralis]
MDKFLINFILIIISLILFLRGFFPVQYTSGNDSARPTQLNGIEFNLEQLYKPEVDRLVFIIIDALRWDFITQQNFPNLAPAFHQHGCMHKVHVQSPTVTLPRIKALTTGRVPQFLDVVLNLVGTNKLNDSILHQAKNAGKKIIFYGDDTWLKLYPDVFERWEGVTSFFVNDYTEVDNNVTSNVLNELSNSDWDIMVLHYLGLDHIGHVHGPFSPLVQPKLQEMDKVFKRIYDETKVWNKKTLVVVTGDHGMKDSGGHGGATYAETYVPFIAVGLPCVNGSIKQIDIPATLSVLLGLELPSSSIGRPVLNMLVGLSQDRQLYILNYVSSLIKSISDQYEEILNDATSYHYKFMVSNSTKDATSAQIQYQAYINMVTENLLHVSAVQDDYTLLVSILALLNLLCVVFSNLCFLGDGTTTQLAVTLILIIQLLPTLLLTSVLSIALLLYFLLQNVVKVARCVKPNDNGIFIICTVLYLSSLQSSSFIEEEHQTWYFMLGTCILLKGYKLKHFQMLPILIFIRFIRTMNPSGDKWSHLPTLSSWFVLEENYVFYQILFCSSLMLIYFCCNKLLKRHSLVIPLILIFIYVFHTCFEKSPTVGKFIWLGIGFNFLLELYRFKNYADQFVVCWILLCSLLIRPHNLVLIPICLFSCALVQNYLKNSLHITMITLLIGKVFFFAQGNGNSFASVDVASGYVGLQSYVPSIVFLQIVCHTYTFPVLVTLFTITTHSRLVWEISIFFRTLTLVTTCTAILIHRHHLFVWSVFAPKLLVESFNCIELLVELLIFKFIKLSKCNSIQTDVNKVNVY